MKYFIFLLLIFTTGCANRISYQDIHQAYKYVDLTDGIDRNEVILIAHKEILNRGLGDRVYSFKPIKVEHQYIWDTATGPVYLEGPPSDNFQFDVQDKWVVLFKDRENTYFAGVYPVIPIAIEIDGKTGEVLHIGLHTDEE